MLTRGACCSAPAPAERPAGKAEAAPPANDHVAWETQAAAANAGTSSSKASADSGAAAAAAKQAQAARREKLAGGDTGMAEQAKAIAEEQVGNWVERQEAGGGAPRSDSLPPFLTPSSWQEAASYDAVPGAANEYSAAASGMLTDRIPGPGIKMYSGPANRTFGGAPPEKPGSSGEADVFAVFDAKVVDVFIAFIEKNGGRVKREVTRRRRARPSVGPAFHVALGLTWWLSAQHIMTHLKSLGIKKMCNALKTKYGISPREFSQASPGRAGSFL